MSKWFEKGKKQLEADFDVRKLISRIKTLKSQLNPSSDDSSILNFDPDSEPDDPVV